MFFLSFFFLSFFRNYWQPQIQQKLVSSHGKDYPYEFFAIKEADIASTMIVGHLPMKNSRVTKFILDRGARVYAILTSTNYCKSSLVQEGLEIPCHIEIHMFSTVKNKELVQIYETFVDTLHYQCEESSTVGSFIQLRFFPNGSLKRKAEKNKNIPV